jgi:hypothetical protein
MLHNAVYFCDSAEMHDDIALHCSTLQILQRNAVRAQSPDVTSSLTGPAPEANSMAAIVFRTSLFHTHPLYMPIMHSIPDATSPCPL